LQNAQHHPATRPTVPAPDAVAAIAAIAAVAHDRADLLRANELVADAVEVAPAAPATTTSAAHITGHGALSISTSSADERDGARGCGGAALDDSSPNSPDACAAATSTTASAIV
jgi:hypothetical protein